MLPFHSRKQVARFKFSVSYLKEKQKENPKNALKQKRDVLREKSPSKIEARATLQGNSKPHLLERFKDCPRVTTYLLL
jgi:hypothetical protein